MHQKTMRFTLPVQSGVPAYVHRLEERDFNRPTRRIPVPPEKLFADLLKRQARSVMADVTECPPDTLPAHLARLDSLRAIISHLLEHELSETRENRASGAQLLHPSTLKDYLACLEITRREHRAPAFVNSRDAEYSQIINRLDLLAGLIAQSPLCESFLESEQGL